MTEPSRRDALIALLAKHQDDGLEAKRTHTYRWRDPDGRERLKPKPSLFERFTHQWKRSA